MSFAHTITPADFPRKTCDPTSRTTAFRYSHSANIGLIWSRYLPAHLSVNSANFAEWSCLTIQAESPQKQEQAYDKWKGYGALTCFKESVSDLDIEPPFEALLARRKVQLSASALAPHYALTMVTDWRMAIGLGNESTFENSGVTLHSTYGFPILPAASLKGVARYWLFEDPDLTAIGVAAEELQKLQHWAGQQEYADWLFGTDKSDEADADEADADESAAGTEESDDETGHASIIRIHDAWPTTRPGKGWFDVDVLTPHHQAYYGTASGNSFALDKDLPIPVFFLTLQPGIEFNIPIGLTRYGRSILKTAEDRVASLNIAQGILRAVLTHIGIGAKTASGYGCMHTPS
jgi:CRISPR-associated protein Cmr6